MEDYLKEVTKHADDDETPKSARSSDRDGSQQAPTAAAAEERFPDRPQPAGMPDFSAHLQGASDTFGSGQLMGLGLSESLPPFEVMEEL